MPSTIASPSSDSDRLPDLLRDVLAGADRDAQPLEPREVPGLHDLLVGRGRRREDGHAVLLHDLGELGGGGRLGHQGAGAGAEREDHQHPQPEGEGERSGAGDHVVLGEAEGVPAEGVVDREHVAVEVRGDLGDAGAAGGGAEEGDVVGGGVDGGVVKGAGLAGLRGAAAGEVVVAGTAVGHHDEVGRHGVTDRLDVLDVPVVDQRHRGTGLLDDGAELAGAQGGHGGHDHAAGLQGAEPGGHGPRVVGRAQQDPVAGHQPEVLGQHGRDLVDGAEQLAVAPHRAVRESSAPAGRRRARRSWRRAARPRR